MTRSNLEKTLLVKWTVENYEHNINFSVDRPGLYIHKLIRDMIETPKPDSVFKFYSGSEKNIESLEKSYLYFSSPRNFNDPWDCLTNREKYILKGGEGIRKHRENLGVCCFSLINNNPIMWGHYTNIYTGFCVKFKDPRTLLFNQVSVRSHVSYLKDYKPSNDSFDKIYQEIENFSEINDELRHIILHGIMAVQNYTWKHIDWSYEKEYRAISYSTEKFNRKLPFDASLVEEIYIGYKMKDLYNKKFQKILEIVTDKYPHIKVFEVKPNPLIVQLDFNEISI
ncbi:DUF2971 domain-containing protein [Xanthomarina sp. GH4-25]|uniref:DUF2971 domain-containing protein n=1 Tax=Xanthomarina sp. GH4-25 TaxID=3349335 RepID=UPI003877CE8C